MAGPGAPTSYLELAEGVPVLSSDGVEIGRVAHVLADEATDIFDGIVVEAEAGPGGHRFVDAAQVDRLYERAVTLRIDAAACADLPRPAANPAVMETDPDDTAEGRLTAKLRRAWDLISGRY